MSNAATAEEATIRLERRTKTVLVSPETLFDLLTNRMASSFAGIPESAKCVGGAFDVQRRVFILYVESPSFEPVSLGAVLPALLITYRP